MADQLIAPVIPSGAVPTRRWPGRPGAAAGLPLASPPGILRAPADVVYGLGRIDASGRVADRAITRALGWRAVTG